MGAPERRANERRVRQSREARIAAGACSSKKLEDVKDYTVTRAGELRLWWGKAVAGQKPGRDRDGVVLRACRRVFDLRRIAELDRYGVAQHVAERPLSIARAIQKTVVLTDKHTDEIAVRGLGKVEDARNLRTCELSRRRRDRLLATEQTVQNVAARA